LRIYYIHHSCFIIETNSSFLIFDYFKSKKHQNDFDFDFKDLLNQILQSDKYVYIFASHSHNDHFSDEILTWNANIKDTYYILSDDIKIYKQINNCHFMKQNEEILINDLKINTFGSTDAGVSFMINIENKNIFFAGDLNWWKWNDDTLSEEEDMETSFKNIINDIIKINIPIDIAFFPVDKRLEENFLCGGDYFIEKLVPKIFIPMHFWDDFNTTKDFIETQNSKNNSTKIIEIKHPNEILI